MKLWFFHPDGVDMLLARPNHCSPLAREHLERDCTACNCAHTAEELRLSFRKRVLRHVVGRAWVPLKDEALYLAFRVILREPDSGHKAVVFPPTLNQATRGSTPAEIHRVNKQARGSTPAEAQASKGKHPRLKHKQARGSTTRQYQLTMESQQPRQRQ